MNTPVTMDINGAKLTVETQDLFRAWLKDQLGTASAQALLVIPDLKEGERYVGAIISADGAKREHIILLPGEFEGNWKDSMAWAESIGGELFDRTEGALLLATMKDAFKPEWYWTRDRHASGSDCAWYQGFSDGSQLYYGTDGQGRARAVRRLPI